MSMEFPADYKDELQLLGVLPQHQLVESLRADAKNKKRQSLDTSPSPSPIAKSHKSHSKKHVSSIAMPTEITPVENSGVTRDSCLALTGPHVDSCHGGLGASSLHGPLARNPGPMKLESLGVSSSPEEYGVVPVSLFRIETPLPLVNESEIGFGIEKGNICGMSDIDTDFGERKELIIDESSATV